MSDSVSKYFEKHNDIPVSVDKMDVSEEVKGLVERGRGEEFTDRYLKMIKTFTVLPASTAMKLVVKEMLEEEL